MYIFPFPSTIHTAASFSFMKGILLLTFLVQCRANVLYVKPTSSGDTNASCPDGPCLTFNQYIKHSEIYFKSNTLFLFLPGVHQVSLAATFREMSNVSLLAYNDEMSTNLVSINASCTSRNNVEIVETRLNGTTQSVCLSLINFESVENVTVKGLTVSSAVTGALLLNKTVGAYIQHCTFICDKALEKTSAVLVQNAYSTMIDDTYTTNCSSGISVSHSNNTSITNVTSGYCSYAGVFIYSSFSTTMENVYQTFTLYGLLVKRSHNTTILQSSIWHTKSTGVLIESSHVVYIIDTTIRVCRLYGAEIIDSSGAVIKNISVSQCNINIAFLYSFNIDMNDCVVSCSKSEHGLTMLGCNNTLVTGMEVLESNESHLESGIDLKHMYFDSVQISNSTNSTIPLSMSALYRGVMLFRSSGIVLHSSEFKEMKSVSQTSETTSRTPSVISLLYSSLTLQNCTFEGNEITAVKLLSSTLTMSGILRFVGNTAVSCTAIVLSKYSYLTLAKQSHTYFINNSAAEVGGVFCVDTDFQYYGYKKTDPVYFILARTPCFLRVEGERADPRLIFRHNTAGYGGDIVYGGQIALGWDGDVNCLLGFKNISSIVPDTMSLITSPQSRVCLCDDGGVPQYLRVFDTESHPLYPGQSITLSAVVTGQDFGTVAGSVWATFVTLPDTLQPPRLSDDQETQGVSQLHCNPLRYTVILSSEHTPRSQVLALTVNENIATSFLDREKVSETIRLWKSTFYNKSLPEYNLITREVYVFPVFKNITILPCPVGFQMAGSEPYVCDCDSLLKAVPGVQCNIQQLTISRTGFVWIGITGDQSSVMLSESCPLGHCIKERVSISLDYLDSQCNNQRAGTLCGGCRKGLSMTLGGNHCQTCSNMYLTLVVPFAFAGIALVLFLKILDLTICQGTINGLILYANVVQANKFIFFSKTTTPLTVFIAWLNLDVGINTCLFDGLTAYGKMWLQFIFPLYIWSIAGLIILVAKYSDRVARVMGNNSVPVLSTLFLLSYAKLSFIILKIVSYRMVYTSAGSRVVWAVDGNIEYLRGIHIPLFVVGVAALLLVWLPYTLLILLGQWLVKCNSRSLTRLLIRLKPFLDAHYAPLKGTHRYWFGTLLLVRTFILLVSALSPEDNFGLTMYSICVSSILLTYVGLRVYQHAVVSFYEASFFVNMSLLAQTTLFTSVYGGEEVIATNVLIGIAFAQFFGLVLYKIQLAFGLCDKVRRLKFRLPWRRGVALENSNK